MEGPLVSDTTELLSGAPSASEDPPVGNSAPSAAAGGSAQGEPGAPGAAASTSKSRSRGGTGLSSLLMPELQRIAQTMGIPGGGRMRKGQLVEAIEARQGGAPRQETGGAKQGSDQRVASAGADATRLRKQDAMEPDTRTGIGDGAAAGIGASTGVNGSRGRLVLGVDITPLDQRSPIVVDRHEHAGAGDFVSFKTKRPNLEVGDLLVERVDTLTDFVGNFVGVGVLPFQRLTFGWQTVPYVNAAQS